MKKLFILAVTACFMSCDVSVSIDDYRALQSKYEALEANYGAVLDEVHHLHAYRDATERCMDDLDSLYNLSDTYFESDNGAEYLEVNSTFK